jgi:NTE family protein
MLQCNISPMTIAIPFLAGLAAAVRARFVRGLALVRGAPAGAGGAAAGGHPAAVGHVARAGWPPRHVSLALQGGGSFGAFTWGVLDRLLEDERIVIDMISGASAGAINGALLAGGLAGGDRQSARGALERFWRRASTAAPFISLARLAKATIPGSSGIGIWLRDMTMHSPPFDLNPLRRMVDEEIDFRAVRTSPVRLMVSATRVRDGRLRIFQNAELSTDHLLASACLPMIHRTIWIDGEMANTVKILREYRLA